MNDSGIIKLFYERNDSAVKFVNEMYGKKMQRLAERMLGSEEDAKECVNDALLRAWDSIPPNKPENLSAYMMALCRNIALNMIDWKKAKKRNAEILSLSSELKDCIPSGDIVDKDYDLTELLSAFLVGISKEKRTIFMRRYWYADSIAEIARLYGYRTGRVKVILHRVRKELKQYLKEEGVEV